jgi:hypothetical protein
MVDKETLMKGNGFHRNPYKQETFPFVLKEQGELGELESK